MVMMEQVFRATKLEKKSRALATSTNCFEVGRKVDLSQIAGENVCCFSLFRIQSINIYFQ